MDQSGLQRYVITLVVGIFQVVGNFYSDGIGKRGKQAMLANSILHKM
jgi:hypothetical protein